MDSGSGEVAPVVMAIHGRSRRGPIKRKGPAMLVTIPCPSDVARLPAWAAKVRRRLNVVEAQLCRLGREKQSMLGQLHLASTEVIDEVLAPTTMDLETPS